MVFDRCFRSFVSPPPLPSPLRRAIFSLSLSSTTDDRDDVTTIRVVRCSAALSLRPTGTDSAVQEVDPSRETETLKTKARGARASRISSAPFPLSLPSFLSFPLVNRDPHHLSLPRSLSLSRFSPLFSHRDLSFRRQARATTLSFVLPLRLTATNCDCDCRSRRAAMCRTPAIRASDWLPASRGTRPPLPTIEPGA